jgi:nitrate/nitrite transporter NarK
MAAAHLADVAGHLFVYFCYGWTLWLYLSWLPQYFKNQYSLELKDSALFSAAVFFAGVIGDALGGVLSDLILRKTQDLGSIPAGISALRPSI